MFSVCRLDAGAGRSIEFRSKSDFLFFSRDNVKKRKNGKIHFPLQASRRCATAAHCKVCLEAELRETAAPQTHFNTTTPQARVAAACCCAGREAAASDQLAAMLTGYLGLPASVLVLATADVKTRK